MTKILKAIADFVNTGDNHYYFIGGAIILVLVIAVIALAASRRKKGKTAKLVPANETAVAAALAPSDNPAAIRSEAPEKKKPAKAEDKPTKVVEVTPVPKKAKPLPPPAPEPEPEPVAVDSAEKEEAKLKRPGTIQIYKDNGGKFRFRLKASNNETIAHSQGYSTKAGCKNGIKAVQAIVDSAETYDTTKAGEEYKVTIGQPAFEVYKDNEGKFRFRLRAANTSNILASQGYTAKDNCINGIRSVKHVAHNFSLADDTLSKDK